MNSELAQAAGLGERLQTTGRFVATATHALKAVDKSDDAKRGFWPKNLMVILR